MARYLLPKGAVIAVQDGQELHPGDVLAKVSREAARTKDITGGLPRVAELFEARKPKDFAVISEIDGIVSFGKDTKGKRKVLVTRNHAHARKAIDDESQTREAFQSTRPRMWPVTVHLAEQFCIVVAAQRCFSIAS